jgi:anti-sigma factor RsiW
MKTTVDSPEFTAWLMGELPTEESAAMERAVAADPALQLAAQEQQQFLQQLSSLMGGSQEALDGRQREKILSAARSRDASQVIALPTKRTARGWGWISLATAALAVLGTWIGWQHPLKSGQGTLAFDEVTREIALLPGDATGFPDDTSNNGASTSAVGGTAALETRDQLWNRQPDEYMRLMAKRIATEPLPSPSELPALRERGFVSAAKHPVAPLPVRVGTASWSWVKRSIIEQGQLPHPSLVRTEELINAFDFHSGHAETTQGITARTNILSSGSVDQAQRILLSLHNSTNEPRQVVWSYQAPAGSRYRLIGFGAGATASASSPLLAPGTTVVLMLELKDNPDHSNGGVLSFETQGVKNSMAITTPQQNGVDQAFFSLLLDYAAWLKNPDSSPAALMQATTTLEGFDIDAEKRTALSVMRKSFTLKGY